MSFVWSIEVPYSHREYTASTLVEIHDATNFKPLFETSLHIRIFIASVDRQYTTFFTSTPNFFLFVVRCVGR